MKILLAPSETKKSGGSHPFKLDTLLFKELTPYRKKLLDKYSEILKTGNIEELSKMFGLKKETDIRSHIRNIVNEPTMKAIERYTGVAFDHLDYPSLGKKAQNYIDNNVILCSNLFGFLRASDEIPEYRLKQGASVGDIKVEKFYHEYGASLMEEYLGNEEILDLRAGFYDKFYKPKKDYTTLKFLKEGKVVSHWAKAYRGIVLSEIAKADIKTLDAFSKLPLPNLGLIEIQQKKNQQEIIFNIES